MGKLTIGYGWNIEDRGITKTEAEIILRGMISDITFRLTAFHPDVFSYLSQIRKNVLIDMAYNLGIAGIEKFKKMWKALKNRDYQKASEEMLNSKWAVQVPRRAKQLAKLMREGK